jgi:hypothetical protein
MIYSSVRRSGRLATTLLPLLSGPLGYSDRECELRLRHPGSFAYPSDWRHRVDTSCLAATGLDFPHPCQDLLPDVPLRFDLLESITFAPARHHETLPSTS